MGVQGMAQATGLSDDERRLAELGYKQELDRSWSGFSNFAISFSIISILAGCFTTFGQGFNNGGPIAISWGWPIVAAFILVIGLTMSELVSAYPTSGGIYWWANKMGGARAGFFTGWLNLIGLVVVPDNHQSFSYVFTERFNNSGYADGSTTSPTYWLLIVPFGLLLTQYTITGFDASAHLSEETSAASKAAAQGIWRSIFYSAIGGWILLLCFLFAIPNGADGKPDNAGVGGGGVAYIFTHAMDSKWAAAILTISAVGQFFCTTSCMTSASRMTFAFSRDGAVPGSRLWSTLTGAKVPANAVMLVGVVSAIITLPALVEVNIGTEEAPLIVPTAFYAVVSVAVIGLYLAFLIPIWLRWKMGDDFVPGSWTNGTRYKWMNLVAVIEIAIISVYFTLPFVPGGVPFTDGFEWKFVNYAPILTLGSLLVLAIWWRVSARHWFKGPKTNIDPEVVDAFSE